MRVQGFLLGAALATTLFSGAEALAQTKDGYPNRALRLIVANVPGGASDFVARIIQPHWAEQLGQPVVIELGFKDMKTGSWFGIFAPKGTPAPVVKRIFEVATKTMEHPDVLKRFAVAGTRAVVSRSPEEFRAFVKAETDNYAVVIKEAGITAD